MTNQPKITSFILLCIAAICVVVAVFCATVTLAGGSYQMFLIVALVAMIIANCICVVVFLRAGLVRWIAVMIALPSLFVICELLRRHPTIIGITLW